MCNQKFVNAKPVGEAFSVLDEDIENGNENEDIILHNVSANHLQIGSQNTNEMIENTEGWYNCTPLFNKCKELLAETQRPTPEQSYAKHRIYQQKKLIVFKVLLLCTRVTEKQTKNYAVNERYQRLRTDSL